MWPSRRPDRGSLGVAFTSIRISAYLHDTMAGLRARDLEAVLAFLRDARSVPGPIPFTQTLIGRLVEVVGCEYGRYRELDLARRVEIASLPCSAQKGMSGNSDRMTTADWDDLLGNAYHRAGRNEREIFSHSDRVARSPAGSRDAGSLLEEPGGTVDRIWVRVGGASWAGFAFDSSRRIFGERDHELARMLRPHLADLWWNASVRRRLRAALAALDLEGHDGVLLLRESGGIEFASDTAQRLLRDYFDTPSTQLPDEITDWHRNDRRTPLVVPTDGSSLVVECADGGFALLLRERAPGVELLTPREHEVMRGVAEGLSNSEIARRLWIELPTVRKHLEHVYRKLGVSSRTAAVAKLRPVAVG
jgi:DNA-binding CsgD family transcriptional regulator